MDHTQQHAASSPSCHLGAGCLRGGGSSAHAAVTSILAASAKPNPTGARMTPADSRCFPEAKFHRHTNARTSLSLLLCGSNPTGTRPPAPPVTLALVASAEANATATRRRHLFPEAKFHRHANARTSLSLLLWARGLQHIPSPRRWLHPQKQMPPPHAAVTSILAASAKPNPTGTRMTPADSRCFPEAKFHRHTDARTSLSLLLCGPNPSGTRPPAPPVTSALVASAAPAHLHPCRPCQAKSHRHTADPSSFSLPNRTGTRTTAPYRCASVDQIPAARGLHHLPSPRRWLQNQIPPAHAAVTSILAASAKQNPTGTRMTPAHSRCVPGAKSYRRTNARASVSLRLCGPNPSGIRPPAPPVTSALVASAEANPTGTRRRHLHPCRLRQAKSHWHTDDPNSFSLLSWSQAPPALGRPRLVVAAPLRIKSHRHAASSTSRHLGAGCNSAGTVTDSQGSSRLCGKLGPAVCGKLGTLETGPILAGNSAGRPPFRPFPGQWRLHGMLQTWYT